VDPVPDPLLLRKSGRAGNRTRDLWICSQKLLTPTILIKKNYSVRISAGTPAVLNFFLLFLNPSVKCGKHFSLVTAFYLIFQHVFLLLLSRLLINFPGRRKRRISRIWVLPLAYIYHSALTGDGYCNFITRKFVIKCEFSLL
jgi:hypothetical protein